MPSPLNVDNERCLAVPGPDRAARRRRWCSRATAIPCARARPRRWPTPARWAAARRSPAAFVSLRGGADAVAIDRAGKAAETRGASLDEPSPSHPSRPPAAPSRASTTSSRSRTRRVDRIATGTITVVPFIALGIVGWQVWNDLLHWSDVAVFLIMYLITGLGRDGRLPPPPHAPRPSRPSRWVHGALAIMGSMAIEGPVTAWVADHRKHHAFSDKEGDPHSPHVGHEGGWRGALSGLFHAHVGWLFIHTHRGAKAALRAGPDEGPADALGGPDLPRSGCSAGWRVAFVLGWLIGGTIDGRLDRPALGRRRADARGAPRDLQHQLALPLLRREALPHRRPLAQPALARPPHARRVLAQQPPRLPHLRRPRAAQAGHRPLGRRHPRARAARPRVGRGAHQPRAPGPEGRPARAVASTAQLRRELEAALPDRPFELELWDGTRVAATTPPRDHLPRALDATPRRTCCAPPASSAWAAPTCPGRSSRTTSTRRSSCSTSGSRRPIDRATRARLALAAARACGPMRPPPVPAAELRPRGERHSIRRDARAVRHHYDLPPEFFALFLGESLTYSCALFTRGATHAGGGAGGRSSTWSAASSTCSRASACSTWAAAGAASRSTPPSATTCGCWASRSPSRRPPSRGSACASAGSRTASRSGWPTTASCATTRSTPWRASAWSSTWARARSTCTCSSWRALLRPGGRLLNHGIARMRVGDPGGRARSRSATSSPTAPRSTSRASSSPSSAPGLVTDHVEGLHGNYEVTLATGRGGWTSTWTRRSGWPAPSACASGASTCAPPGAASRAASSPSTRCGPRRPGSAPRRSRAETAAPARGAGAGRAAVGLGGPLASSSTPGHGLALRARRTACEVNSVGQRRHQPGQAVRRRARARAGAPRRCRRRAPAPRGAPPRSRARGRAAGTPRAAGRAGAARARARSRTGSSMRASMPSRVAMKRFSSSSSGRSSTSGGMIALLELEPGDALDERRRGPRSRPRCSARRGSAPPRCRSAAAGARPTRGRWARRRPRSAAARPPPRPSRRSRGTPAGCPRAGTPGRAACGPTPGPVSRPCQSGELADSASSSGRWPRIRFMQVDRGVRRRDPHVHVERERGLPAGELAHRVVHALVARAGGHPHLLPDRERVGAAGRGTQARACASCASSARAQVLELGGDPGHVLCTRERSSSADLWVSGGHVRAQLRLERRQHPVDLVGERPRPPARAA